VLLVAAATAAAAAGPGGRALKLQGTWQTDDAKGRGTWAVTAQVERPQILRGAADYTDWEAFTGTLRAAGIPGLEEETPVSGWMVNGTIAIRIKRAPWDSVILVGTVDGARVRGTVRAPDGHTGAWQGWWIAPTQAPPPADGEPRLSAVEE
jgi:hypothetical protein